jgi:TIR domain
MAYQYDVFISYKNHHVTNHWVIKFEERLSYWLTQSMGGYKPNIFFDKDTIEIGSIWPNKLRNGLKFSKIILCIWTPEYFNSKWCLSEWHSFEERERQFNLNAAYSLVYPIQFADGIYYPDAAQRRQPFDVRDFNATMEAFWLTPKAIELEYKIQDFAEILALGIREAPNYDENFPIIEINENPLPPNNNTNRLKLLNEQHWK